MKRIAAVLVALASLGAWAQTALEGSFHMHALARIDGDRFAIASGRTVEVRSFANPARPLRVLSGAEGRVSSLAATPDGRLLAAGDQDGHVLVWDLTTGALLFRKYAHVFTVWTVAFSPDGTLLASGAFDARVKLWEVGSWREAGILIDPRLVNAEEKDRAHVGWVRCVLFSPDGRTLVTSGCDGFIRVWDVDTLRLKTDPIQAGINVYRVAFSPDGTRLACVNNPGEIRVYRTDTWSEELRLRAGVTSSVYVLAFTPDGKRILAAGFGKKVEVWDLGSRAKVAEYSGASDSIWGLIVFPDGERVVTTSGEYGSDYSGEVRLWRIAK
ncbi:MAG: WD40 repeat domain-containing protein [Candidatus Bipolaricaulota bacterium]|nr:WD40 repeat domain-containing protein [Candidatus Bipolaricaulota bacterium]